MKNLSKKQQKNLLRIIVSLLMLSVLLILSHYSALDGHIPEAAWLSGYVVVYLIIGHDVLWRAMRNIRNGQIFDENFLMSIATLAAFAIGEYTESASVMLFYQIGEFFQDLAVAKSRNSISHLMELAPELAWLEKDGEISETDPYDVSVGDIIVVRPGEKIPLDGVVVSGSSFIDTSALTGESVRVQKQEGDPIQSGCVNGEGTLHIEVTKAYEESTVAIILDLVENASEKKTKLENFITRFARYYTPVVTIGAVLLALIPPLFFGGEFMVWIRRACVFLIVSCPCALVISVPLGFFCGIAAASKIGVLIKGSSYLEALSGAKCFAFDKTGTITKGVFKVIKTIPAPSSTMSANDILTLAAAAESFSNHPIAISLAEACGKKDLPNVDEVKELAGRGISTSYNGKALLAGNSLLMEESGISGIDELKDALGKAYTVVYVAYDGVLLGAILLGDELRENAAGAIAALKKAGITHTIMFTGDHEDAARSIAESTGIDDCAARLLPQDKVARLEEAMKMHGSTAFIGDGINDAPVLMRSDVGIAMGAIGSDAAIEAADIVLMHDDLNRLPQVLGIAKKTTSIVKQNIVFAIGVKLLVLLLGAFGIASMWSAVFADVGVCVLAVLNSMRTALIREQHAGQLFFDF